MGQITAEVIRLVSGLTPQKHWRVEQQQLRIMRTVQKVLVSRLVNKSILPTVVSDGLVQKAGVGVVH